MHLTLFCAGEAVYVDDIPSPKGCLYGAFIYSAHPHAHIKGIKFRPSLASDKVIAVIDAKGIPSGGENIGSTFAGLGDEALFADSISEFAGQNIGVVVLLNHFNFLSHEVGYVDP
jgi:indole-3-acetaldehyde oxidase